MASVYGLSSMSRRTNIPCDAARVQIAAQFSKASAGSIASPTAVGFTEMFAGRPDAAIASTVRMYCSRVAIVWSLCVTLSPSTSMVPMAPSAARPRIVSSAASSVSPAT